MTGSGRATRATRTLQALACMACVAGAGRQAAAPRLAELPRVLLGTAYVAPSGARIIVAAHGDLQAALNRARPGDQVLLTAGATYTGNYVLPRTPRSDTPIHIRTGVPYESLPPEGTRMTPTAAAALHLSRIVTPNGTSAVTTAAGAANWRIVGVEISVDSSVPALNSLVRVGDHEQRTLDSVVRNIVFDRVWLHGWPTKALTRAIILSSASTAVVDSWIADCHVNGADAQAIVGWNGPGPYKIVNNHLEASGENVMFGGADPLVPGLIPSDIEIRANYFTKPVAWKGVWTSVKNLFELKNAARVLVDGNVFSGTWRAAQAGFAMNLKSVNQTRAPWSSTKDITIRYNRITNVGAGISISGTDQNPVDTTARRLTIHDNIVDNVNVTGFEGPGAFMQLLNRAADVVVDHNTFVSAGSIVSAVIFDNAPAVTALTFTNNIVTRGSFGFKGSGVAEGSATLAAFTPAAVFARNAIVGGSAAAYPGGNYFPPAVGFDNVARQDYQLSPADALTRAGTDGRDVGADVAAVMSRTARVIVSP